MFYVTISNDTTYRAPRHIFPYNYFSMKWIKAVWLLATQDQTATSMSKLYYFTNAFLFFVTTTAAIATKQIATYTITELLSPVCGAFVSVDGVLLL